MKFISGEFIRFLVAGGVNTLVTYILYLLLLEAFHYTLAYSIAYLIGIVGSYYINCYLVFKEPPRLRSALRYPVVYLVQYLVGVLMLFVIVDWIGLDKRLAPLFVIAVTVPVTFLLSRFMIRS